MKRNVKQIKCQLCSNEYSSVGVATHLKSTHSMSVDEYVKKFGEFRKNKLNKKLEDTEKCLICNDNKTYNRKGLTWHLRQEHNIDKIEYVKQYILEGDIPKCKCGCEEELSIKHYHPYVVGEFKSGHNSKGENNPRYGTNVSTSTRKKMQLKALNRIERYKNSGQRLPMHHPDAIAARGKFQTEKFIKKIESEYDVTVLNRVQENDIREYTLQCNNCNNVFTQYHQQYFTCWTCNHRYRSKKEQELIDIISTFDINFITNDRSILSNNKELDFYFPDHKLAIEFDGLYWHSELQGKERMYHLNKTKECEDKGIHLIHIFEDEWEHHKEIVIGKIKSLLNKDTRTNVYARSTKIKELSYQDTKNFLDVHHLQGADHAKYRIGLFYNDVLISVMTFSKPNASKGNIKKIVDGTYELSRFCTHSEYRCIGGASKLLKYFINQYSPKKIISYADRRYSKVNNNLYNTLGFVLEGISSPNYWYFSTKELKRYHRFNFTKKTTIKMGGDSNKTEWENMVELGYNRIWDCGHLKYELLL
jgi:very-short-patch-repair endonuclease